MLKRLLVWRDLHEWSFLRDNYQPRADPNSILSWYKDISQTIKNKKSSFKDWTPQQFTSKNISPNIDTKFPFCRMTKDISHAIVTCARLQQLWKQVENLTDHKTV